MVHHAEVDGRLQVDRMADGMKVEREVKGARGYEKVVD